MELEFSSCQPLDDDSSRRAVHRSSCAPVMESTCAATFSNRAQDDRLAETRHISWTSGTGTVVYELHSKVPLD